MGCQAALFAGFLSSFLIELLARLEPDPMDIIQDVLIYQTQMMRNSSLEPYVPADFSPPEYIVVVNALFYASLGVMLLAAFIAMLIKTWVREFDRGLQAMALPERPVNSGSSGWNAGSSQRWSGYYHYSSRYRLFYFSSVLSCFFSTSVHPRLG